LIGLVQKANIGNLLEKSCLKDVVQICPNIYASSARSLGNIDIILPVKQGSTACADGLTANTVARTNYKRPVGLHLSGRAVSPTNGQFYGM
jgi:hypothetical protein